MKIVQNNYSKAVSVISKGWIICLLFFCSCSEKDFFSEYHSIPDAAWHLSDTIEFKVPVSELQYRYDIFFELRNNNQYKYRNIWLFIDFQTPSGNVRSDTLNAELADIYGKWYGKGINLYNYTFPYGFDVQYKDTGTYIYRVRQGMRDTTLNGISDIGMRILKKAGQ